MHNENEDMFAGNTVTDELMVPATPADGPTPAAPVQRILPAEVAQAAPANADIDVRTPITDIAQLPPIWGFESNVEWLIEGILPLGSVNLITSESGTGKTWVAYAIAGAVARGMAFAGQPVRQRPVVYLDGENPLCIAKQRLWDLGIAETPKLGVWGGWLDPSPPGPNSALVRNYAREHHPLLIWDSLVEFHDGEEQSATETRKFMNYFRQLAHLGATILILHHTGKTTTSLGGHLKTGQ